MPTFGDLTVDFLVARSAALGETAEGWRRQRGDGPLGPLYYAAGSPSGVVNADTYAVDELRAVPFLAGRGLDVDQLSFRVAVAGLAGSVARVGIYEADERSLYPTTLMVDGGEKSGVAPVGVRSTSVLIRLNAARLYYFVYICGVTEPQINAVNPSGFFGISDQITNLLGSLSVPFAYGVLPAQFPSGAVPDGSTTPLIAVRAT